jgi:hypothetical protein
MEDKKGWSNAHAQLWTTFKKQQSDGPSRSPPKPPPAEASVAAPNYLRREVHDLRTELSTAESIRESNWLALEQLVQIVKDGTFKTTAVALERTQHAAVEDESDASLEEIFLLDDPFSPNKEVLKGVLSRLHPSETAAAHELLGAISSLSRTVAVLCRRLNARSSSSEKRSEHDGFISAMMKNVQYCLGLVAPPASVASQAGAADSLLTLGESLGDCHEKLLKICLFQNISVDRTWGMSQLLDAMLSKTERWEKVASSGDERAVRSAESITLSGLVDMFGGDANGMGPVELCQSAAHLGLLAQKQREEALREKATLSLLLSEFERWMTDLFAEAKYVPSVNDVRAALTGRPLPTIDTMFWARSAADRLYQLSGKAGAHQNRPAPFSRKDVQQYMEEAISQVQRAMTSLQVECDTLKHAAEKALFAIDKIAGLESTTAGGDQDFSTRLDRLVAFDTKFVDRIRSLVFDLPSSTNVTPQSSLEQIADAVSQAFKAVLPIIHSTGISSESLAKAVDRLNLLATPWNDARLGEPWRRMCGLIAPDELTSSTQDKAPRTIEEAVQKLESHLVIVSTRVLQILGTAEDQVMGLQQQTQAAMRDLAQLLVTAHQHHHNGGGGYTTEIVPPVDNLSEMVQLVQARFGMLMNSSAKVRQGSSSSHDNVSPFDRSLLDDVVRSKLLPMSRAIAKLSSTLNTVNSEEDFAAHEDQPQQHADSSERNFSTFAVSASSNPVATIEKLAGELESRFNTLRTRVARLQSLYHSSKIRVDNSAVTHATWQKRWQRTTQEIIRFAHFLKVECVSSTVVQDRDEFFSSGAVLHLLRTCHAKMEESALASENARLREEAAGLSVRVSSLEKERSNFKVVLDKLLQVLGDAGAHLKQSLFQIGCDDQPTDPLLEQIRQEGKMAVNGANEDEDALADLSKKMVRWSERLSSVTEEHLQSQRKIAKYFAAVFRIVCCEECDVHDASLLDIDSSMVRFADGILPALETFLCSVETNDDASDRKGGRPRERSNFFSTGETIPPAHDHRLARVHEIVTKINFAVDALQRVRYLTVPSDTLEESTASPTRGSLGFVDADADVENLSSDDILRLIERNLTHINKSVSKFGTNYKTAAIVLQKDIDKIQEDLCVMLSHFSELDVESAFNVDREELGDVYLVMKEKGTRQRGCYFFNRPHGEGVCPWSLALHILAGTYGTILDKLEQRTLSCKKMKQVIELSLDHATEFVLWAVSNRIALPAELHQASSATVELSDEQLPGVIAYLLQTAQHSGRSLELEEENHRLVEQAQLLRETTAVLESRLKCESEKKDQEVLALVAERDAASSEASVARAQLRRLQKIQTETEESTRIEREKLMSEMEVLRQHADNRASSSSKTTHPRGSSPLRHFTLPAQSAPAVGGSRTGYLSSVAQYMRTLGEEIEQRQILSSHITPSRDQAMSPAFSGMGITRGGNRSPKRERDSSPATNSSPHREVRAHTLDCPTCERRNLQGARTSPPRHRQQPSTASAVADGISRSRSRRGEFVAVPTDMPESLRRPTPEPPRAGPPPPVKSSPVRHRHPLAVIDPPQQKTSRVKVAETDAPRQKSLQRVQLAAVGQLQDSLAAAPGGDAGSLGRAAKLTIPNLNHDGAKQLVAAIAQHSSRRRI